MANKAERAAENEKRKLLLAIIYKAAAELCVLQKSDKLTLIQPTALGLKILVQIELVES